MFNRVRRLPRLLFGRPLQQRLIDEITPPAGRYSRLTDASTISVADFPVFGSHELRINRVRRKPASFVAEVNHALVHGSSLVAMTTDQKPGTIWLPAPEADLRHFSPNFSAYFAPRGDQFVFLPNPRLKPSRHYEEAIILGGRLSVNYFHWLTEGVVSGLLLPPEQLARTQVLVRTMPPQHLELLRHAYPGVKPEVLANDDLVSVGKAILPTVGAFVPEKPEDVKLAGFDPSFVAQFRTRFSGQMEAHWGKPGRFVYVSRRLLRDNPLASRRNVANQDEVEAFVQGLGARIIHPETLSAQEQIAEFASADLVVLPAGSGIANIIFCRPGARVICLCQNRLVNPEYFALLADACGLRYAAVACAPVPAAGPTEVHADFVVDLRHLRQALDWAEHGGAASSAAAADSVTGSRAPP